MALAPITVLKGESVNYLAKDFHPSALGWFTGGDNFRMCHEKRAAYSYKNKLILRVFPMSMLVSIMAVLAGLARKNEWLPPWALSSIKHPYAAQVFGIVVGYLLIMRLNMCVQRWDAGMSNLEAMEAKWTDAYTALMTFVQLEIAKKKAEGDLAHLELLNKCKCLIIHCFSLLNALAVTSLAQSTGELYGRVTKKGRENIFHIQTIPFAMRDDDSGLVDFHKTLMNMKELDVKNHYASKEGWIKRVIVIGDISEHEMHALHLSSRQAHLVYIWATELMTFLIGYKIVDIAPPLYTRCYQELSSGMLGFVHSIKSAALPFPVILTQLSYILLLMIMTFVPFLIEKFTESIVFTALLTFGSVFGMLMIHVIAVQLEMPYGEEFMDLPLLEMHTAFNRSLLLLYVCPDTYGHPMLDPLQDARKTCSAQKAAAAMEASPSPPTEKPAAHVRPSSSQKVAPPTGVPNGGHGLVGSADLPGLLQESKGSPIEAWTSEKSVPGAGAAAVNKRAGRARSPPNGGGRAPSRQNGHGSAGRVRIADRPPPDDDRFY